MVTQIVKQFGTIDYLVYNASITRYIAMGDRKRGQHRRNHGQRLLAPVCGIQGGGERFDQIAGPCFGAGCTGDRCSSWSSQHALVGRMREAEAVANFPTAFGPNRCAGGDRRTHLVGSGAAFDDRTEPHHRQRANDVRRYSL